MVLNFSATAMRRYAISLKMPQRETHRSALVATHSCNQLWYQCLRRFLWPKLRSARSKLPRKCCQCLAEQQRNIAQRCAVISQLLRHCQFRRGSDVNAYVRVRGSVRWQALAAVDWSPTAAVNVQVCIVTPRIGMAVHTSDDM